MAATRSFTLDGMDKLNRLLVLGGAAAVKATGRALYWEANTAFNMSQGLVPVATGALKSSGRVDQPKYEGRQIVVDIAYGTPYALAVHENLESAHAAPTSAKYLEIPVVQQTDGMGSRIADRVEATLRSYS